MAKEKKITIKKKATLNPQGGITLTPEAVDCLISIMQKTGLSARIAASTIITQAVHGDLIEFIEDEDE